MGFSWTVGPTNYHRIFQHENLNKGPLSADESDDFGTSRDGPAGVPLHHSGCIQPIPLQHGPTSKRNKLIFPGSLYTSFDKFSGPKFVRFLSPWISIQRQNLIMKQTSKWEYSQTKNNVLGQKKHHFGPTQILK